MGRQDRLCVWRGCGTQATKRGVEGEDEREKLERVLTLAGSLGLQLHRERSRAGRGRVSASHIPSCLQGMSETFETLHNLVHKGVKVVMDIPYELWNETSAEVADLKKQVRAPPPPGLGEGGSSVNEGPREPGDCGQAVSPRLWLWPPESQPPARWVARRGSGSPGSPGRGQARALPT